MIRHALVLAVAMCVFASAGRVYATQSKAVVCVEFVDGGSYEFSLHPTYRSDVFYPEPLTHVSSGNTSNYDIAVVDTESKQLGVQPDPFAPPTNVNTSTASARTTMRLTVVQDTRDSNRIIFMVRPEDPIPSECPLDSPVRLIRAQRSQRSDTPNEFSIDATGQLRIALRHKLREERLRDAREMHWTTDTHRLAVRIGNIDTGERFLSFVAVIQNEGDYAFPLQDVRLRDHRGQGDYLDQQVTDAAGAVLPDELRPGAEVSIAISGKNAAQLEKGWILELAAGIGIPPAQVRWGEDAPELPYTLKKLTLGPVVRGGVAQFTKDGEGSFTSVRNAGIRARYGYFKSVAFEGTLAYIGTGDASFMNGETMSISGAQFMVNGVVTLGTRYQPFIRIGGGLVPAKLQNGGDSRFAVFPIFGASIGIDAWLGHSLVVGASLDATGGASNMPLVMELGAHVSYAWDFLHPNEAWRYQR